MKGVELLHALQQCVADISEKSLRTFLACYPDIPAKYSQAIDLSNFVTTLDANQFMEYVHHNKWLLPLFPSQRILQEYSVHDLLLLCPEKLQKTFTGRLTHKRLPWLFTFYIWAQHGPVHGYLQIDFGKYPLSKKRPSHSKGTGRSRWESHLDDLAGIPLLTRAQERDLTRRIRQGDNKAQDELVLANQRFVVSIARQYLASGMDLADLVSEGNIGLIKAAQRFDETLGNRFISYAVWWIRQAILQALAEQSRAARLPQNRVNALHRINKSTAALLQKLGRKPSVAELAEETGMNQREIRLTLRAGQPSLSLDRPFDDNSDRTLIESMRDPSSVSPARRTELLLLQREIVRVLDTLTKRQADVIKLYFGLDRDEALTLEEIGKRYSLTRERIRQIKEKAIVRLRHATQSENLKRYLALFQ